jgi:nitrate reductase assembly molybdenum cofactor insertion protein NarJ
MVKVSVVSACYDFLAESWVYPPERDTSYIEERLATIKKESKALAEPLERFWKEPASHSTSEYIQTVELNPPVPLYLGTYFFEEPESCQTVGLSDRNGYMLELKSIYRHFGFDMNGKELADYLPMMVSFLGLSLAKAGMDKIGLRRRFIEIYLKPGMEPIKKRLVKHESTYAYLIDCMVLAMEEDLNLMEDTIMWQPPEGEILPKTKLSKDEI